MLFLCTDHLFAHKDYLQIVLFFSWFNLCKKSSWIYTKKRYRFTFADAFDLFCRAIVCCGLQNSVICSFAFRSYSNFGWLYYLSKATVPFAFQQGRLHLSKVFLLGFCSNEIHYFWRLSISIRISLYSEQTSELSKKMIVGVMFDHFQRFWQVGFRV